MSVRRGAVHNTASCPGSLLPQFGHDHAVTGPAGLFGVDALLTGGCPFCGLGDDDAGLAGPLSAATGFLSSLDPD